MNYKRMFMIILLFPVVGYGHDNISDKDKRIEELEHIKFKTEAKVVALTARVMKEQKKFAEYTKGFVNGYWKPQGEIDTLDIFKNFMKDLAYAFDKGEDIDPIINKAPLVFPEDTDSHFTSLAWIIQMLFVERLSDQCKQEVFKLAMVNKEIATLKS